MGKKAQKKYGNPNQNPFQKSDKTSQKPRNKTKKSDKEKVGEYIDFEEID